MIWRPLTHDELREPVDNLPKLDGNSDDGNIPS